MALFCRCGGFEKVCRSQETTEKLTLALSLNLVFHACLAGKMLNAIFFNYKGLARLRDDFLRF